MNNIHKTNTHYTLGTNVRWGRGGGEGDKRERGIKTEEDVKEGGGRW